MKFILIVLQTAIKKMKKKFFKWEDCIQLREVKVCQFWLVLFFHLCEEFEKVESSQYCEAEGSTLISLDKCFLILDRS